MSNKKAAIITAILTIVVMGAVFVLNGHIIPYPDTVPLYIYKFPSMIATINAICSVVLIASFIAIKKQTYWFAQTLEYFSHGFVCIVSCIIHSCTFLYTGYALRRSGSQWCTEPRRINSCRHDAQNLFLYFRHAYFTCCGCVSDGTYDVSLWLDQPGRET